MGLFPGEQRVQLKTGDQWNGMLGTLVGQGPAGGAVIPDGTRKILNFKLGEFDILPEDSASTISGQANPKPA